MWKTPTGLVLSILFAAMLLGDGRARAENVVGSRIFVEFGFDTTAPEMKAAQRWGAELFAKAKAAGRPVTMRVARSDATILIMLESVAICDRVKACPLLVFRDITAKPVLKTTAFQNLILDYRDTGTYLIIRIWDSTKECRVSNVAVAKCRDPKPAKR